MSDRRAFAAGDRQLRQGFQADGGNPVRCTVLSSARSRHERTLRIGGNSALSAGIPVAAGMDCDDRKR